MTLAIFNPVHCVREDVLSFAISEILPLLTGKKIICDYRAKRVGHYRDLAPKTRFIQGEFGHDHVHLVGNRFEDAGPKARIKVSQIVWHSVIVDVLGALPL